MVKKKIKKKYSFEHVFSDPENIAFIKDLRKNKILREKKEKIEREEALNIKSDPRLKKERTVEEEKQIENNARKKFLKVTMVTPRFKAWKFSSAGERLLWNRLNRFWREVEYDFKFVRYPDLFLGFGSKAKTDYDKFTEESLLYDSESLDQFFATLEDSMDKDVDIDFSLMHVCDNFDVLGEDRYDISFFLIVVCIFSLEFILGGGFCWLWFFSFLHEREYEPQKDEEDEGQDINEIRIDNIYNSYYETSGYRVTPWYKPIYTNFDFNNLRVLNSRLYSTNFFFSKIGRIRFRSRSR